MGTLSPNGFGLLIQDYSERLLSSTDLPLAPPEIALTNSGIFWQFVGTSTSRYVFADPTSLTLHEDQQPEAVPEPSTLLMVSAGLAAGARLRPQTLIPV